MEEGQGVELPIGLLLRHIGLLGRQIVADDESVRTVSVEAKLRQQVLGGLEEGVGGHQLVVVDPPDYSPLWERAHDDDCLISRHVQILAVEVDVPDAAHVLVVFPEDLGLVGVLEGEEPESLVVSPGGEERAIRVEQDASLV